MERVGVFFFVLFYHLLFLQLLASSSLKSLLLLNTGSSPAFYLADEKLNFVKVRCFSSLSQTGLEDVLKPRVILALSNLQLRGQSMHPTPVVYAGDLTSFSTNPKEVHLQESFSQLKTLVQVRC